MKMVNFDIKLSDEDFKSNNILGLSNYYSNPGFWIFLQKFSLLLLLCLFFASGNHRNLLFL